MSDITFAVGAMWDALKSDALVLVGFFLLVAVIRWFALRSGRES